MNKFELTNVSCAPSFEIRKRAANEYLKGRFFAGNPEAVEQVSIIDTGNVPERYRAQIDFQRDPVAPIPLIAVIPNAVWQKSQPTESSAEHNLVLFRADYWEEGDDIAWMTHELGHCERFQTQPAEYTKDQQEFAIGTIVSEHPYPNNKVEEYAFTKQFNFLRQKGTTRAEVLKLLETYYSEPSDFAFFNELLDRVYQ